MVYPVRSDAAAILAGSTMRAIGQQFCNTATTEYDALNFIISQLISKVSTCTLVQVKATTRTGLLDPVGFVDVQPLVHLINGLDEIKVNSILSGLPVFRLQAGSNAVIIDPEPGDIGIVVFASRDISSVIKNSTVDRTKAASAPGSYRRYSISDGLYIGGVLNNTPGQYVRFNNTDGITIHSPVKVTINAPAISIVGDTTFTGKVTANGHRIDETHTHTGVQSGSSNTGVVS